MTLRVAKPGLLSTVQDRGRHGLQHLGIVPCGAMDPVAHALANALVGNDPDAATLEATIIGPELVFGCDALIALCGAEFDATLDGRALPRDRPVLARARSRLVCGRALRGSRAYLGIAGGIALEPVLGSRSTYLPARFGGLEGRALRAGDSLPLAPGAAGLAAARYAQLAAGAVRRDGVETVRGSAPPLTLPDRAPAEALQVGQRGMRPARKAVRERERDGLEDGRRRAGVPAQSDVCPADARDHPGLRAHLPADDALADVPVDSHRVSHD